MGRGLSPLQQQILTLAWEREQATPVKSSVRRLLFPQEIYVRLYHWPITHPAASSSFYARERGCALGNSLHFQPSVIGVQRYRSTMVAVSRALGRLQRRGLLPQRRHRYTLGWCLTDEGRTVAQAANG